MDPALRIFRLKRPDDFFTFREIHPTQPMNHLHFLTDLELTPAEKASCLRTYILRTAAANCRDSGRQVAQEMVRIEKALADRDGFQLIPVDDEAVLARRQASSALARPA